MQQIKMFMRGRPRGSKDSKPRIKKQFCVHGHDTFICGRTSQSQCRECQYELGNKIRLEIKNGTHRIEHIKEFCIRGHNISVVGRTKQGDCVQCVKNYKLEHPKQISRHNKKYREEHPDIVAKCSIRNKTNRAFRVVAWTDWENINKFERNKPTGMTTDHYIPLQGDSIAGLHVSWNLQYMPKSLNSSKNNNINLLEASEWYGQILKQAGLK